MNCDGRIRTHNETPDDKDADDVNGRGLAGKGLTESCDDNDHELDTVWNELRG